MKRFYLVSLLSLCLPFSVLAENNLADFASQMNAITKGAFTEMDKQMAVKINLSGKQRMLSQKMTKEALLISLGVDTEVNKKNLEVSATLFDQTLKGLQSGDESLNLTKTDNTKIIKQLNEVTTLWKEFYPNIKAITASDNDNKALKNLASMNLPLLKTMNKAVGMYTKSSGADLNDLANVINLSGRQRMLTQKMTKELLLVASDINKSDNLDNLKVTAQLFDKTLKGLMSGDKDLNLPTTKSAAILKQLVVVKLLWDEFQAVVEKADTSTESLKKVAELNLPLLAEMGAAVKMYEEQSKK